MIIDTTCLGFETKNHIVILIITVKKNNQRQRNQPDLFAAYYFV